MAITTLQQIKDLVAPRIVIGPSANISGTSGFWNSVFGVAGFNGTAASVGNTANGRVPTDALTGFPSLPSFGGTDGFITRGLVRMQGGGPAIWRLYDRLFDAGPYDFNSNVTLASQPSFLSRIPGGTAADTAYETELWLEGLNVSTTGVLSVTVTYTNQAGTTGRSTGAISFSAAAIARRMIFMPLQAGDTGISQVNTVVGSVASAGTAVFNVVVMRRLLSGRILIPHNAEDLDLLRTCQVPFSDSAALNLTLRMEAGLNSQPPPNIDADIAWG